MYSNGATADAWPWRNATVMASWPQKPVMPNVSSSGQSFNCTGTQFGQAIAPAPTATITIIHSTMLSVLSVRLDKRPTTAATA